MKFFSANLQDLRELYINTLQKTLDMERQIIDALPTMAEKSTDSQLKNAFNTHLKETRTHADRLERILNADQGEASTIKCKVLSALVSEAQDMIKDASDPTVRDAALIAAGQQVEHHEMAIYGTLRNWAEVLGETDHAEILQTTLDEEKNADEMLTQIAEVVNPDAEAPARRSAA